MSLFTLSNFKLENWFSYSELEAMVLFAITLLFAMLIFYISYTFFIRKRMNELERMSKAKTHFINKIAYEIRSPLNGILGFSEMLEGGFFGELNLRQRERIRDINRCGADISRVIDDISDLSATDAVGIELVKTRVNMQEIINHPIKVLESKIRQSGVHIVKHLNVPNIDILVDRHKMIFVIRHVLENAIKFSRPGGQVTITNELTGTGLLQITIADSGHGMTKEILASVFMYPDHEDKKKSDGGIGLGLPLSQLFMRLHDGNIKISSQYEVGTTVIISLPI